QDSGRAQDTPKARAGPRPADMVLLNGKILLFHGVERKAVVAGKGAAPKGAATSKSNAALDDAAQSDGAERPEFAEAAAIAGGRIAFVGTAADAKAYIGPKTQTIDLEGRMVMPGIIDGHFHGTRSTDCEMGYAGGTVAQILAKLQACLDRPDQAALKKSNVRLSASHFFGEEVEPPGTALTRYDLDRLETTRPIFVENADGHKFWMNSRAIDNAHIDEHTPVPSGAQIGRDASGKPNGFFSDYEPADWGQTVPVTEESKLDVVRRTIADANRMGITSVFVPGGGEEEIAQWAKIQDDGKLT